MISVMIGKCSFKWLAAYNSLPAYTHHRISWS